MTLADALRRNMLKKHARRALLVTKTTRKGGPTAGHRVVEAERRLGAHMRKLAEVDPAARALIEEGERQ